MRRILFRTLVAGSLVCSFACGSEAPEPSAEEAPQSAPAPAVPTLESVTGPWRGVLTSPGGELPFALVISAEGGEIHNGDERVEIESAELEGDELTLRIDRYAAVLVARIDGDSMSGHWRKETSQGHSELPFHAQRGTHPRFESGEPPDPRFAGQWSVTFRDEDGESPARGEFRLRGSVVTGTFATSTGDYRYLEGVATGSSMRLSTFDGAHAFLFDAELDTHGQLSGNFWSRDTYHATWTGRRIAPGDESPLPDPFAEVRVTSEDQRLRFSFPTLEGETVTMPSELFDGRVVVIDIFGTWCPNCADLAPLVQRWEQEHQDDGLSIVGIAFEASEDLGRRQLARWKERYDVHHPLLFGGIADKAAVAAAFPDLSTFRSYPTLIFVGRDGRVRHIFSGFYGPATGDQHTHMVGQLETRLEALLAETL